MTDQRIIECAKAVADLMRDPQAVINAETIARACILKWLEQEPSPTMIEATDALDDPYDPTHLTITSGRVYTAMCEQAAKEIGG